MLPTSALSFTPAQARVCVNTTLALHPWWVLRLLLSRCLVKEQQEKLNESNKHDSCWRHDLGITTKAGGKQCYSLITFSSLISVSHENKCHLPSYLSLTTTRKSKKRSKRKANNFVTKHTSYEEIWVMVTWVPVKSRKDESIFMSCFQKMFKCTSSIYQTKRIQGMRYFKKEEYWLIHVQLYPVW